MLFNILRLIVIFGNMQATIQTFRIKHMICTRCIDVVANIFKDNHSEIIAIDLGVVEIKPLEEFSISKIKKALEFRGFELLVSEADIITEKVKVAITKLYFHKKENKNLKTSVWLEEEVKIPYQKLCKIFSKNSGTTIEKYVILQKIERVKELIGYNEKKFEEISKELGYKNLSHLSSQFKKIEQKSLTEYKNELNPSRKRIDKLL